MEQLFATKDNEDSNLLEKSYGEKLEEIRFGGQDSRISEESRSEKGDAPESTLVVFKEALDDKFSLAARSAK